MAWVFWMECEHQGGLMKTLMDRYSLYACRRRRLRSSCAFCPSCMECGQGGGVNTTHNTTHTHNTPTRVHESIGKLHGEAGKKNQKNVLFVLFLVCRPTTREMKNKNNRMRRKEGVDELVLGCRWRSSFQLELSCHNIAVSRHVER
jgi:hypothetical protein